MLAWVLNMPLLLPGDSAFTWRHAVKYLIIKPFNLLNIIPLTRIKDVYYQPDNELLIKKPPRTKVAHFQNNNFKHKMKNRLSMKLCQKNIFWKHLMKPNNCD